MRSRSVTSRGVMLAGSESGSDAGGGDGDRESEREAEGEGEGKGDTFPEWSGLGL